MTDEHEHAMKVWREALRAFHEGRFGCDDQAAAAVIAADRAGLVARIVELEGEKRKLIQHSLDTLYQWRLCGEALGLLGGWVANSADADHLALLRANTEAFLARAALKDTRHDA